MTTEAGKRLHDSRHAGPNLCHDGCGLGSAIEAIEAEAVAVERARIAEGVRQMASGGNYADERTQITLTAVLALIEDDEHYPGCPRNDACACAGRTGVPAKPAEGLDAERLARAMELANGGAHLELLLADGAYRAAAVTILRAALREGRTPQP